MNIPKNLMIDQEKEDCDLYEYLTLHFKSYQRDFDVDGIAADTFDQNPFKLRVPSIDSLSEK